MTCVFIIWVAFLILLGVKNENTWKQHKIIGDAIYRYHMDEIKHKRYTFLVGYDDMEDYDRTLFRIWDWGYSKILPPDKLNILRPYINK